MRVEAAFFLVLLKEMRILGECKVLSILFLLLIKGMRRWDQSKIFFCNHRNGKLLLRPSASEEVS